MIDLEFLEKLIRTLDRSGIDHIEIERGGTRLRVSKTPSGRSLAHSTEAPATPPAAHPAGADERNPEGGGARSYLEAGQGAAMDTGTPEPAAPLYLEVTSPMVGTFYRASAPDADPFTDVGKRIRSGDPLCIIEAMKLMNELEAELDGVVREICVANGEPVEYGQVLFRVEPS